MGQLEPRQVKYLTLRTKEFDHKHLKLNRSLRFRFKDLKKHQTIEKRQTAFHEVCQRKRINILEK